MKRNLFYFLSIVLALTFGSLRASAQSQDWFVRVGASGNYYWGDDDTYAKFFKRLSPTVNLTLGKWFNPYWGVQVVGNYGKIKGACLAVAANAAPYNSANGLSPYSTGEKITDPYTTPGKLGAYYEKFSVLTIQPEVVYNLSNGICGYNPDRVWNMLVHVGPSYGHSWANGTSANSIFVTGGLTSTWRIDRNVQLWADARLTMFGDGFDKVDYREGVDHMGTISAGISVNFGK